MDNAACLYIKVHFPELAPDREAYTQPKIVHAELLFGSRLKEHHEPDEDNHNDNAESKSPRL